ncbi:MAG: hypothetical protein Q7U57_09265 [Methylovulum sp.]|nr:hypothetical protein [Methylovulum sp.]
MRDEYDFSNDKLANEVPHLTQLQAENIGKSRITLFWMMILWLLFVSGPSKVVRPIKH